MSNVKKERPTRGEPINIPEFMLSPQQRKSKKKKRQIVDDISFYMAVFCGVWMVWFCLYLDTNQTVGIIGVAVTLGLILLIRRWRRRHGYGGEYDLD